MNNFKWSLVKCWWNYYIFFLCKTFPYWYTGIYVRSRRHPILAKMILYSVLSTNKLLKLGPSLCWFILRTAIRNLKAWIHNNISQNTMWHNQLISSPPVPHICVSELGQHWFRWWLGAYSAPSHYLNQCLNIVNWTLGTNFGEILIKIRTFSFKNIHLKMLSAKWRPFCPGEDELIIHAPDSCLLHTSAHFSEAKPSIFYMCPFGRM